MVRTATPGATTSGNVAGADRPQLVGPRLLKLATTLLLSVAPTAKASGLLAGLASDGTVGPKFPAAKTGVMPPATSAARSGSNSSEQPGLASVQELLTMLGASAVAGLWSGSSNHW